MKIELNPEQRASVGSLCEELHDEVGMRGRGRFVLLQTVSHPQVEGVEEIVVDVVQPDEGQQGQGPLRLVLMNYSSAILLKTTNLKKQQVLLKDILPVGMYIALHSPKWTTKKKTNLLLLLCDNPRDIQLLSWKEVEEVMGQGFIWPHHPLPKSFWNDGLGTSDEELFNKLRTTGNKLFLSSCFSDAVRFYDLALKVASTNAEKSVTLSNKAAALLRLRCPKAATGAARAALDLDPGNGKALYRLARGLLTLGDHEVAVAELERGLRRQGSPTFRDELKELLETAKKRTRGPPSTEAYMNLAQIRASLSALVGSGQEGEAAEKMQRLADSTIAEFVGPVSIQPAGGEKGLGLFAVEDISPGQVLLVSRAMAFHHCQDVGGPGGPRCTPDFVHQIANKLHFDDENESSDFYRLYAGPPEERGDDPIARIKGIIRFTNPSALRCLGGPLDQCGFWLLPSFINHSCSSVNCVKEEYEDVAIFKAVVPIPKGGEVLWEYVPTFWPYEEKEALLKAKWGFTCTCALCRWELGSRGTADGLRYGRLAKLWHQSEASAGGGLDSDHRVFASYGPRRLLEDVKWLDGLVRAGKHPGPVDNVEVHGNLVAYLLELGKGTNNADWYRGVLAVGKITTSGPHLNVGKMTTLITNILALHVLKQNKGAIRTLLEELKEGLVAWFGSVEGVNCLGHGKLMLMMCLGAHGIDFYSA